MVKRPLLEPASVQSDLISTGLPEQAYKIIRKAIVSGRIKSGVWLRQRELARELGVGTSTVREALKRLAATPVFFPITEIYTAVDRGVVDGEVECWEAQRTFNFLEVTKYRTAVSLWTALVTIAMNLDAWNSLPPDIKQLFEEDMGLEASRRAGSMFDAVEKVMLEEVKNYDQKKGNPEIYYLPEDERARWREAVTPLYEEFTAERETKGLPARAFFNDMLELAEKYNK